MSTTTSAEIVDRIMARLLNVRRSAHGATARCPAHDDTQNSLSIGEGKDGRILVHCFVGCSTPDVIEAMGLTMRGLFPEQESHSEKGVPITVEDLARDK